LIPSQNQKLLKFPCPEGLFLSGTNGFFSVGLLKGGPMAKCLYNQKARRRNKRGIGMVATISLLFG